MKKLNISENRRLSMRIAHSIKNNFLRDIPIERIADGVKRVGQTDAGILTHGFLTRGLMSQISHRCYGNRRWRNSFKVDGIHLVPVAVLDKETERGKNVEK